jgi:hypothetical protein
VRGCCCHAAEQPAAGHVTAGGWQLLLVRARARVRACVRRDLPLIRSVLGCVERVWKCVVVVS